MHLYSNEEDDDDVSVLTSSTNLTKDSNVSNSSFVKLARENLERLILESKNSGDDDGKSLTRISEEGGSQNSSCNSKSRSSKSSSVESDETNKMDEKEEDYNDDADDDDDTISLAESILVSANKVLSNIGSSPYYAGRSKKLSSPRASPTYETYESPLPQLNPKQSSPMKQPTKTNDTDNTGNCSKNIYSTKKEFPSSKKISNDQHGNQLEVSSNFLSSYFSDENIKPSTNRSNHNDNSSLTKYGSSSVTKYGSSYESSKSVSNNRSQSVSNDQSLQKLESETKHLQLLLKEQQLETKKASQSLGLSINKANALLERLSADRNA